MGLLSIFSGKKQEESSGPVVPLAEDVFRDLIFSVEEKELRQRLPELTQKKVLEISPRQKPFTEFLTEKGSKFIVRLGGPKEKETAGAGNPAEVFILAHWESLPFLNESSDFVLMRMASLRGSLARMLREVGRVLRPQGVILFTDLHPFSQMIQKEHLKNPVGEEGLGPGFERYFKWFREAGLRVDTVKEIFFEGALRKFFATEDQKKYFDQVRRTPFLIFFSLRKD